MMSWVASNLTKLFIVIVSIVSIACGAIGFAVFGAPGAFAAPIAWIVFMGIPTFLLDRLQKKAMKPAPLAPEKSHVLEYDVDSASFCRAA